MAEVGVAHPGTSADVRLELTRSEGTVDIPNNRSFLNVQLRLYVAAYNGAGGPFNNNGGSNGQVGSSLGTLINVTKSYDLRSSVASSIIWGTWSGWVDHDPDGKKTVTFSYSFTGQGGTPLGNGSGSDSIVLTAIPRGPKIKDADGTYHNTLMYVKDVDGVYKVALGYVKDPVTGLYKIGAS